MSDYKKGESFMALAKSEFDDPNYGKRKKVNVKEYSNPFDAVAEYIFFLSAHYEYKKESEWDRDQSKKIVVHENGSRDLKIWGTNKDQFTKDLIVWLAQNGATVIQSDKSEWLKVEPEKSIMVDKINLNIRF